MKNTIVCFSKSPISYFRLIRSYFVFSEVGEQVERFCTSHLPKLGASWERACYTLYLFVIILLQQKNQWGGGLGGGRRSCLVEVDKPGVLVVMEDMLDQVRVGIYVYFSCCSNMCIFNNNSPAASGAVHLLVPCTLSFFSFPVLFFSFSGKVDCNVPIPSFVLLSIHF